MKFKTFFTEMPYVEVIPVDIGDNDIIDMEFELLNGKPIKALRDMLAKLFSGAEYKDKYGNVIHIKTAKQKNKLKKSILNNKISISMLNKLFGISQSEIKAILDEF